MPSLKPYLSLTLLLELLRRKRRKGVKRCLLFLLALGWLLGAPLEAQTPRVPRLLNFQSVLTDPAGRALADGFYNVHFRLLDPNNNVLYQETQNLETADGVVSAMIGSQGELTPALFDPQTPLFLGVQVEGQGEERLMEIVTVPYALHAEQAFSAAAQSITTAAIQPGAITSDLLADEVLEGLLGDAVGTFTYSAATTIPAVLQDLDNAIQGRQAAIDQVRSDYVQEDARLEERIASEVSGVQAQVRTLDTSVNSCLGNCGDRLDTAERNIDTLLGIPRVAAAGIVAVSSGAGGLQGNLTYAYNAARVSREGNNRRFRVHFNTPIAPPYIVVTTPNVDVTGGGAGSTHDVLLTGIQADSFAVNSNLAEMPSFHFVVIK